jgi:hypothetical protein
MHPGSDAVIGRLHSEMPSQGVKTSLRHRYEVAFNTLPLRSPFDTLGERALALGHPPIVLRYRSTNATLQNQVEELPIETEERA